MRLIGYRLVSLEKQAPKVLESVHSRNNIRIASNVGEKAICALMPLLVLICGLI